MKIEVEHMFTIGVGASIKCKQIISEIYEVREKEYYELYINSKMSNDSIKRTLTMEEEESVNKLIGIIEYCHKKSNYFLIEKIISKLNPSIMRFFKKSDKTDLHKFQMMYLDKISNNIEEMEIFAHQISLIYLSYIYDKDIILSGANEYFILGVWEQLTNTLYHEKTKYDLEFKDLDCKPAINSCYKLFEIDEDKVIKNQSLNLFLENFIESQVLSKFKEEDVLSRNIDLEEYKKVRINLFREGMIKYIGAYSRFCKTLGLNSSTSLSYTTVNNDILNMIFKEVPLAIHYNSFDVNEIPIYIISCLFLYNYIEMYKTSKDIYLNVSKEEKYKELIEHEKSLREKENEIREIISKKDLIISNKDEEIRKLKEEIKSLKQDKSNLNKEIIALNNENKELNDEFMKINSIEVEKQMNEIESNSEVTYEEAIENLKDKNIVIFGGANNIKNIKTILPNVILLNDINKDISIIKNVDLIVINSQFFSHSFTKKINSVTNKYKIKYNYICGTNFKKIIFALNSYLNN